MLLWELVYICLTERSYRSIQIKSENVRSPCSFVRKWWFITMVSSCHNEKAVFLNLRSLIKCAVIRSEDVPWNSTKWSQGKSDVLRIVRNDWLTYWLIDLLAFWWTDCLTHGLTDRVTDRLTDGLTYWRTNSLIDFLTQWPTDSICLCWTDWLVWLLYNRLNHTSSKAPGRTISWLHLLFFHLLLSTPHNERVIPATISHAASAACTQKAWGLEGTQQSPRITWLMESGRNYHLWWRQM